MGRLLLCWNVDVPGYLPSASGLRLSRPPGPPARSTLQHRCGDWNRADYPFRERKGSVRPRSYWHRLPMRGLCEAMAYRVGGRIGFTVRADFLVEIFDVPIHRANADE